MSGIQGAIVQFKNPSTGAIIASTTTDIDGAYSVNVPEGTYVVNVIYPTEAGYRQAFDHVVISDPDITNNGSSFPVTGVDVVSGQPTTVSVYSNRVSTDVATPPIAYPNTITNNRLDDYANILTIPITAFVFDAYGSTATYIKIISLPSVGTLKYNGSAVTTNQEIALSSGNFAHALTYESDQSVFTLYNTSIFFQVKSTASSSYSEQGTITIQNTSFNVTFLYPYQQTGSTAIRARSWVPISNFMIDTGSLVQCWGLHPTQVKEDAVQANCDATWTALFALDIGTGESGKINKWSNFSPVEWYVNAGVLTPRKKQSLDYRSTFAGYDHGATGPSLANYSITYKPSLGDTGVGCMINLGQIDWSSVMPNSGVCLKTYNGATLLATKFVPLSSMVGETISLFNTLGLSFSGSASLTSVLYFSDADNNKIADIPGVTGFTSTYEAPASSMYFLNTPTSFQAQRITSAAEEWTIVSKPAWITLAVYSAGVLITGGNPYLSGYDLRVTASANTGLARTGVIELSEGITINVSQQGVTPTVTYVVPDPNISITENFTTFAVGATTVPFNFTVNSGLGNSNVAITIDIRKYDGVNPAYIVGDVYNTLTRDGRIVNGTLEGLTTADIDYGYTYFIYVQTLA